MHEEVKGGTSGWCMDFGKNARERVCPVRLPGCWEGRVVAMVYKRISHFPSGKQMKRDMVGCS